MLDATRHPDDHPGVGIDDEADIGHPGPGRDERQIRDPQLVRSGCGERALDQIRVTRRGRVGFGGADSFAAPYAFDASGTHQPGHLISPDVMAGSAGCFPQLARPVDAVVVLPELAQRRPKLGVTLGSCRRSPGLGVVVGARGHRHPCGVQDGADGLDPELGAVGVDEVDYFLCWRSSSAPKKLAARFRISLVI